MGQEGYSSVFLPPAASLWGGSPLLARRGGSTKSTMCATAGVAALSAGTNAKHGSRGDQPTGKEHKIKK